MLAGDNQPGSLLDTFAILPHLQALAIAYVLAFPIGWDREREDRSAGLRTFPLVAIASCGFIQASEGLLQGEAEGLARIVEGVITGIGFIGGGAILKGGSSVQGTATAAALWATGAIGVASALGAYDVAVVVSIATFLTLRFLTPLKAKDRV
jgi:putative Mg2+ transporter-C (MgtC) family protein